MKHLALLSLLTLSTPMWASTSAPSTLWHTDFANGKIPSDLTVAAEGQPEPVKMNYKHGYTTAGWTIETVGRTICAVSPTSNATGEAMNSTLTLPALKIEDKETVVRWSARSILPGLLESYQIKVRPAGSDEWTVIATVNEENPVFTTRVASLAEFAGQEVEIQFVANSANRYMLALNLLEVGTFDTAVVFENQSPRFAENAAPRGGRAMVKGTLRNVGSDTLSTYCMVKAMNGANCIGSANLPQNLLPGESAEIEFEIEADDDATTPYTLVFMTSGDEFLDMLSSDVTRSAFARNHFVDEGTGVWCNNCPQGVLNLDELDRNYPGQMIPVATHINDVFSNDAYWANLKWYAVPYFMLDRNRNTSYSSLRNFADYYNTPTEAELKPKGAEIAANGQSCEFTLDATFSKSIDNASGRYGIGYVLTGDFHIEELDREFCQVNSLSMTSAEQYYFLPSVIPASLCFYNHVSVSSDNAFTPVENSLPAEIEPYTAYEVKLNIPNSDYFENVNEGTLVAFVLDTQTGEILNAVSHHLAEPVIDDTTGVDAPTIPATEKYLFVDTAGCVTFDLGEKGTEFTIDLYNAAGTRLASVAGSGNGVQKVTLPQFSGFGIVTLTTADGHNASVKTVR